MNKIFETNIEILEFIGTNNYLQCIINKKIRKIYIKKYKNKTKLLTIINNLSILKYNIYLIKKNENIKSKVCTEIIKLNGDNIECLEYAYKNRCIIEYWSFYHASLNGNLQYLKYAYEHASKFVKNLDKYICMNVIESGNLDCLKYIHQNGCKWTVDVCWTASSVGNLNCLKYLHENGCPWNEDTCYLASKNGHLSCLKYAHENECTWNSNVIKYGLENNHMDCVEYARANGCPEPEL
jgi:hypothetical protein